MMRFHLLGRKMEMKTWGRRAAPVVSASNLGVHGYYMQWSRQVQWS